MITTNKNGKNAMKSLIAAVSLGLILTMNTSASAADDNNNPLVFGSQNNQELFSNSTVGVQVSNTTAVEQDFSMIFQKNFLYPDINKDLDDLRYKTTITLGKCFEALNKADEKLGTLTDYYTKNYSKHDFQDKDTEANIVKTTADINKRKGILDSKKNALQEKLQNTFNQLYALHEQNLSSAEAQKKAQEAVYKEKLASLVKTTEQLKSTASNIELNLSKFGNSGFVRLAVNAFNKATPDSLFTMSGMTIVK